MSKTTKIILGILIALIVLCCCACIGGIIAFNVGGLALFQNMFNTDPAQAAATAKEMVDYQLPAGYQEQSALNFFVGKMVIIGESKDLNQSSSPVIILFQVTAENASLNEDEIRQQMEQSMMKSSSGNQMNLKLVSQKEMTIRGQQVTLFTYEGTTDKGQEVREVITSMFQGKTGSVLIMVGGNTEAWDTQGIEAFFKSIR